jgi:hypothetical protein
MRVGTLQRKAAGRTVAGLPGSEPAHGEVHDRTVDVGPDRKGSSIAIRCGEGSRGSVIDTLIEMSPDQDEVDTEAALGSYGDAVDMAAKIPTLGGVALALVVGGFVWAWQRLRRHRRAD